MKMNTTAELSSHDRILRAAKLLFAQNGYENASPVAIARDAGTSESQLMKHFGSKQGLLVTILDLGWNSVIGAHQDVECRGFARRPPGLYADSCHHRV